MFIFLLFELVLSSNFIKINNEYIDLSKYNSVHTVTGRYLFDDCLYLILRNTENNKEIKKCIKYDEGYKYISMINKKFDEIYG